MYSADLVLPIYLYLSKSLDNRIITTPDMYTHGDKLSLFFLYCVSTRVFKSRVDVAVL